MSKCPYYEIKTQVIPSTQHNAHHQQNAPTITPIPWCSHAQSPFPLAYTGNIGAATGLRCQGLIANCPISPNPHL